MTKVCRLCLTKLQRGSKYFNINAVESFTGFMPYRDQLTTCIPEMALDLIPNPVICNNCRTALKSSYDFKSRCLLVEKKIREYVESQPSETSTFDLTEIDTSSLPKPARFEAEIISSKDAKFIPLLPKTEPRSNSPQSSSILSDLLTVREEVILPHPSEIEITNVKFVAGVPKVRIPRVVGKATKELLYPCAPIERDEQGLLQCNHCNEKFENVPALHLHKNKVHEEDYLCNFCNIPFKTLQNLRKHNQLCQKARSAPAEPAILTKRPHLPTKAKNHLKRWLFNHTDHPYPTDVEKQQLMKETNLSLLQVENWFINARRRILADLTRIKNLRGRSWRGRRGGRGRGRVKMEPPTVLEEELFEDDTEAFFEELEFEGSNIPTSIIRDLEENESDITIQEHSLDALNHALEIEGEDISEETSEMQTTGNRKEQNEIEIATVNPSDQSTESAETTDEEDPLEDMPLKMLRTDIKMEVDDER